MSDATSQNHTQQMSIPREARGLLLMAFLLASVVLQAQNNLATLTGAITDASSASIPGATIEALNAATGVVYRGSTTDAGIYTIPLVPPGTYKITAMKGGFQGATGDNIEVRTGDRLQLDLKLEVGSATQNVTVSAEAPLLDTATASRGTVLSTEQVSDLPVNGRNVTLMSTLAPGVQTVNDQASTQNRPFDGGLTDRLAINGGRSARNNYLLNGISNFGQDQSNGYANVNFQPSPDAVQEVRVQTSDYSAEFGHTSGGTINVNLKSGTNQLHGTAYYFLQNTILRANTFTNNATNKPISAFQWNEPGLEFGGPLTIPHVYNGKNRTFWMFAWERITDKIPTSGNFRVPTLLERTGDFSQTRVNGVPITIFDPITRQPFSNGQIPQINPVAAALLKYFPLPNIPVDASGNNFYPGANAQTDTYDTFTTQVDQIINDRNRLTMTFGRNARSQRQADNGIAEEASTDYFHHRDNTVAGVAWTDVLNPTTVLNVRSAISRHLFEIDPTATEFGATGLTGVGFPASLVSQLPLQAFPNIGFCADTACSALAGNGNYLTIGGATNFSGGLVKNFSNNFAIAGTLSKNIGRHALKFGAEFDNTLNNRINAAVMTLPFSPVFTQQNPTVNVAGQGNAFADFLLGYPGLPNGVAAIGGATPITPGVASNISPALSNKYYALFVQDDVRLNSRLTVNLGLRWDVETAPTERYNRQNAGFDPQASYTRNGINFTGGLLFVNADNRTPFADDWTNFQPRVGAAYKLTDKAVLRGGFALMYLPAYADSGYYNGFSNVSQYVQSNDGNLTPANSLSNPFPNGLLIPSGSANGSATLIGTGGINFSVSDRPVPNVKQFTLGIQQQLPSGFVADLSYAGSRTRQLEVSSNINYLATTDLA
jgi:outer membrane receptor protein involved in Fe transport